MVLDYTTRVHKINNGQRKSKLVNDVSNYIYHHLSEPIKTSEIAKNLYMGRSYLSTKFKNETGKKLIDYILECKINEAQYLLKFSDKSVAKISDYLGFVNQSHFTRTFQKFTGQTPNQYRLNN